MSDYFNPLPLSSGPSQAAFDALFTQVQGAVPLPTYTVATLPVANLGNLNRLVGVSDLFGNRTTRMRCERITVGGVDLFYWQPQSSDSYADLDVSSGNQVIGALTMASSIGLIGNVGTGITRTVSFQDGAFPGQTKEVRMGGLIGALGGLNILGVGLGAGLSLLAGGYAKYASDWTSGSPVWKRIA
jgi:hypothetical protein